MRVRENTMIPVSPSTHRPEIHATSSGGKAAAAWAASLAARDGCAA
jgi:hypothetical protein